MRAQVRRFVLRALVGCDETPQDRMRPQPVSRASCQNESGDTGRISGLCYVVEREALPIGSQLPA
jgi:hypothetical protein